MKIIRLSAVLAVTIMLTSCVSQTEADINLFTQKLNESGAFTLCSTDYRITAENDRYKYFTTVDENAMLCIYTDSDGVAVQCTLTSTAPDSSFKNGCFGIARAFLPNDTENITQAVEEAFKNGSFIIGDTKLTLIDSEVGQTFLINKVDDRLNENSLPTLKKPIKYDDISRPILDKTESHSQ